MKTNYPINFTTNLEKNVAIAQGAITNTPEDIEAIKKQCEMFGVRYLDTLSAFEEFIKIDVEEIDNGKSMNFTFNAPAKKPTIIIFDNAEYNSTYLLESFNKAMESLFGEIIDADEMHTKIQTKYDICYCDNLYLRMLVFNPFMTIPGKRPDLDLDAVQHENISPVIMLIPENKECSILKETFIGIITEDQIREMLCEFLGIELIKIPVEKPVL